jgi:hypothetical protein
MTRERLANRRLSENFEIVANGLQYRVSGFDADDTEEIAAS